MAIKVKDLVKILKGKDQNADVEFVVVKTDGTMVCMDLKGQTRAMASLLKMFGGK